MSSDPVKRREYELVEVGRIKQGSLFYPQTIANFNAEIARILRDVPAQYHALVTLRIVAKPEHIWGETEGVDMEDVQVFPEMVLAYAIEKGVA
jgi:hypothetical protein